MAINSIGGPGSTFLGNTNLQALPLKTMTMLVMAEVMTTREDSQKQMVEELAAKNAKIKEYNDAMSEATRLAEAFSAKAESDSRRPVENDHNAITWESMDDWNKIVHGDVSGKDKWKDIPKGSIMVPNEKGELVEKKLDGLSFEERLNLLSDKSKPPMTDSAKEFLRGRARLADIAQTYGMLPSGLDNKGTAYTNIAHGDISKGTLDTLKTKLKTAAEALGSENQLEMIKLQQEIGKVDAAKTALSQYTKTAAEGEKEIVQKF
jgi:hypothetical protein